MLTRLAIRNYAIISELDLTLQPGLSVITGETGAGKSILLGALGLALGRRADSKSVSPDNAKCIVEAHFKVEGNSLHEIFEREGLDNDEVLICRRELTSGGKSRSFINDTPVSLKVMQEIADQLIELHQQHDSLALQSREYQTHMLDVLSNSTDIYDQYRDLYRQLQKEKQELQKLKDTEISSSRKKDFLLFQLKELEAAQLKAGEMENLEETQNLLQHAESIQHVLDQCQHTFTQGPQSINNQLTSLIKQLDPVKTISSSLSEIRDRVEALRVEVQDLALESSRIEGPGQNDPSQLSRIEGRLNQLYTLIKKYQVADDHGLMELQKALSKELNDISSAGEQIIELEKRISITTDQLLSKGENLSTKRKAGAKKILPSLNTLLHDLGMPNAKFEIGIDKIEAKQDGLDEITFMFSANKGMSLQPIQSVASGGELSRLSLALKSLYAKHASLPTIVFDEIDSGISGEVAWKMGQLIRTLAKGHQILMITHSPQIAAHASTQYHVSKISVNEKDTSKVQLLTHDLRLVEIAKMLSGDPPSKEALANAKSLVGAIKN